MEEKKTLKIYVEEKTTKDGRKFKTYKTVTKNGRKIDCKFRKEVTNVPAENSIISVYVSNMNMQKNSEFPVLWVSQIESIEPMAAKVDAEANAKTINEWF